MWYWHKTRQWNGIQTAEVNSYIYSQLIIDKDAKIIQWGKIVISTMVLGQQDIGKNEVGPLLKPYAKINSEGQRLNVWDRTENLLEENIRINLHDLVSEIGFLDMTPRT